MQIKYAVVVGAGGIGAQLVGPLSRWTELLTVVDGDTVEEDNLDRQLFTKEHVGRYKVDVLKDRFDGRINPFRDYLLQGNIAAIIGDDSPDVIIACPDNNAARMAVLDAADYYRCPAVLCGNGTYSAYAVWYHPHDKGSAFDPRVMMPEIRQDTGQAGGGMSCTQQSDDIPQLVSANMMAAAYAMKLLEYYFIVAMEIDDARIKPYAPIMYKITMTGISLTKRIEEDA